MLLLLLNNQTRTRSSITLPKPSLPPRRSPPALSRLFLFCLRFVLRTRAATRPSTSSAPLTEKRILRSALVQFQLRYVSPAGKDLACGSSVVLWRIFCVVLVLIAIMVAKASVALYAQVSYFILFLHF